MQFKFFFILNEFRSNQPITLYTNQKAFERSYEKIVTTGHQTPYYSFVDITVVLIVEEQSSCQIHGILDTPPLLA